LNSCTVTENIVVPSSPSVNVTLFGTNPTSYSNNGTITAFITSGTPPFTWTWSPNANGKTNLTITNLSAGTYDINVIDSEGCIRNKKITLVGSVPLTDSQLYNICDSNFANTGTLLTKGIKQMLNEGFYDLTSGDTNCILNQSIFTIFLTVGDLVSQSSFFTGTTLNEYPSNEQFSNVLENLLDEYAEITGVTINMTENTIKLTTPCNTLSGTNIEVDLLINYDISCEALATVSFDSST